MHISIWLIDIANHFLFNNDRRKRRLRSTTFSLEFLVNSLTKADPTKPDAPAINTVMG